MESHSSCSYDALEVFDGISRDANKRLAKLCGNQLPNRIMSTGHELLVRFRSDFSKTGRGFKLRYDDTGIAVGLLLDWPQSTIFLSYATLLTTKCRELWAILQPSHTFIFAGPYDLQLLWLLSRLWVLFVLHHLLFCSSITDRRTRWFFVVRGEGCSPPR